MQRPRLLPALIAMVLMAVCGAPSSAVAAPRCGNAAADELEQRLPVQPYDADVDERLGETRCFDFTGDGRKDIVFSGYETMTGGATYWAAFRATAKRWKFVTFRRVCCEGRTAGLAAHILLRRRGRTLRVLQPIYRSDDANCCPTGGQREGRWRWRRGTLRLIAVRG